MVHAVREEMALTVQDVVLRRTDLGTAADPGEETLSRCTALIARELGWDDVRGRKEMADANAVFADRAACKNFGVALT